MCDYINEVLAPLTNDEQSVLILDKFSGHETDDVMEAARSHNIHIIWVPAGATPICQPMDITTIGAMKSHAVTLWCAQRSAHPTDPINNIIAVGHLLNSHEYLDIKAFSEGFLKAMNYDEWPPLPPIRPSLPPRPTIRRGIEFERKYALEAKARAPSPIDMPDSSHPGTIVVPGEETFATNPNIFEFPGTQSTGPIPKKTTASRSRKGTR
jgi:hypothetical protein